MELGLFRPVWADVDLSAVAHNIREIRRLVRPKTHIMAIVKANGYGHGAARVARTVLQYGADSLGVATLGEALQLRQEGIKAPILILGYTPAEQAGLAVAHNVTQTIYTPEMAEAVSGAAVQMKTRAAVHIKIDTGMGRIGFLPGNGTMEAIRRMVRLPGLFVEGIFTHFAAADWQNKDFTWEQFARFQEVLESLSRAGIDIPIKHAANSAAVLDMPETHLDMVRPGIILYGLYPSEKVRKERVSLSPAMALKTRVSFVKRVGPGTSISYGRKYITTRETLIASLPLGYADGYSRLLSNQGEVLIRGKRLPVVGTVCMDQLMVDVGELPNVSMGDEAVLFGSQGGERIAVEEIAERLNTINYEILCMVGGRVPRVYVNESLI